MLLASLYMNASFFKKNNTSREAKDIFMGQVREEWRTDSIYLALNRNECCSESQVKFKTSVLQGRMKKILKVSSNKHK